MSIQATLKAEKRDATGKGVARKLRADGRIPAVVYGQGDEAIAITLDAQATFHLFSNISVENTIVELDVEGEGSFSTLVREVQTHPYRPDLMHVDFYLLQKGVKVEVEIPVVLVGTPAGVKAGGVLQQVIHEVPVSVIPSRIPESFELDVSALEVGDVLDVSAIELPDDVDVGIDLDRTVCTVVLPRAEEVDDDDEADDVEEPEVIGVERVDEDDEE